jgi:hypothetical protein
MNKTNPRRYYNPMFRTLVIAFLIVFTVGLVSHPIAQASSPLSTIGYLDYSYGTVVTGEPTAEKPESKLWWNDGFWWGSLYNESVGAYHIYRLDWGTQDWEDTGVPLDDRQNSRADTLWDSSSQKLYVASHVFSLIASKVSQSVNYGRLYRYSYDVATQTYSLDSGFPVTVNQDKTEAMVLDKDSTGRLWVTYVSRNPSVDPTDAQVYFNRTTSPGISHDLTWGTPLSLGDLFPSAHVSTDDIASIIAFDNKIGIMWTNQNDGNFYFAYHDDTQAYNVGWTLQVIDSSLYSFLANDHINLAKDSAGDVFAAIKSSPTLVAGSQTGLLARDANTGAFTYRPLSASNSDDTRPIVVVDDTQNKVYIFKTSKGIGGVICYQDANIVYPLSNIALTPDNCRTSAPLTGSGLKLFISDSQYKNINNATSSKQNVNSTTGLVVLASDNFNSQVYVHNVIGDPPPVVTHRFPDFNAQNAALNTVVLATFSKDMNDATLNSSNFKLSDPGGNISGSVVYNNATRTVSFTPSTPLKSGNTYTATLTSAVKDNNGQSLFGAPETWQFTTGLTTVQFDQAFYSQLENGGSAVITASLSQPSSQTITVDYATSDGTAQAPGDYTATSGTLTFNPGETIQTFQVPIIDNAIQDGNRTVNLTLSNPSHATLGAQGTAQLTIVDDDKALVLFKNKSYVVNEGAGFATISVSMTMPLGQQASVDYATSDGTAHAPADYTAISGSLIFSAGQISKTLQVPIINDSLFEADETINLTLSNPVNVELGTPNDTAILTIKNDDPMPEVMFDQSSYEVSENAGSATITVTLSSPSGADSQVQYQTADWIAIAGVDYTATSGVLNFAPGETSKTFSVPILDDALNEPQKSLNLILSAPSNVALGTPIEVPLIIDDNDAPPTIQFGQAEYIAIESSGIATVNVTLNTASGQTVAFDLASSDGSALAGKDYEALSDTAVVFLPGETSKTITVHVIKDNTPEPRRAFFLTISNPDAGVLGTPSIATVYIDDGSKLIYLPMLHN